MLKNLKIILFFLLNVVALIVLGRFFTNWLNGTIFQFTVAVVAMGVFVIELILVLPIALKEFVKWFRSYRSKLKEAVNDEK